MPESLRLNTGDFKHDFLASIVVFLVALPLCLGIAIASGAPPMTGLISGIVGGLVVSRLGGAPLQVSGPAAGLVALVSEAIHAYGMAGLGLIVLIAGVIQMAAGWLKLGRWFRAMSPAVIYGMLGGIGVLIVASQFHVMLDVSPESSGIANILTIPDTIAKGLFPMDGSSHHLAALIGVITIGMIGVWTWAPERIRIIPAALVAVLTSVVIAQVLDMPIKYVDIPDNLMDAIRFPGPHSLPLLADGGLWLMGMTIALVASAETMLSASAVDRLHNGPRTQYDKELLAQGVANSLAGLLGALPITGVIVRSSANVQAGARTSLSATLHAVWLLGLVLAFPNILELIPTASLAAVLVYTGYKLVQPATIRKLLAVGKSELAIYLATLTMVVTTNLLEGVIVGCVLAIIKLLIQLSQLKGLSELSENGKRVDLYLTGSATFLSLPTLSDILERQPLGKELHVHVHALAHLDHACLELLQSWQTQYAMSGGEVIIEWQQAPSSPLTNGTTV